METAQEHYVIVKRFFQLDYPMNSELQELKVVSLNYVTKFLILTFYLVFWPKWEEAYIPKFKSINIDGAFFGTSVPHIFLRAYKEAVILPPRIFNYEPKIHGFNLYKKTGSRAVGSKDVILYPKFISSKIASEELKDSNQAKLQEENIAPEISEIEKKEENKERQVTPKVEEKEEKAIIPDEDTAMIDKVDDSEQNILNEIHWDEHQEEKQNVNNKKRKRNKKNKNKGKN